MDEDRVLTFEELLGELMGMLGEHVVVAAGAWALTDLPKLTWRAGPEGFEEVWEGEAKSTLHPVMEAGGRLRRGAQSGDDPDGVVFIVGEEQPRRFARVHLSPSSVVEARWLANERLHGGGQIVVTTLNSNVVMIHRVDYDGD